MTPLRERTGDIERLTEYYIAKYNGEFRKRVRGHTPEARTLLSLYRGMLRIRLIDERMMLHQRQGRIGFYGSCTGQEATPVEPGTGSVLRSKVDCLRICEQGPICVVYPEGTWYAGLTIEDLDRITAYSQHARRSAVIGGGLLGLEAAKAAYDLAAATRPRS